MKARLAALLGLALLLMLGLARASAATAPAGMQADPAADLRAGRPFVVVVVDQGDQRLVGSEAYADWQSYHRRFVASARGTLPVYTLAPARARLLLPALGRQIRRATVFVDAQGRGLVHDGLVLEPVVYAIGRDFAQTGVIAPRARDAGLRLQLMKP